MKRTYRHIFYGLYLLVSTYVVYALGEKFFRNEINEFYDAHMPVSLKIAAISYNQPEIPRSQIMWIIYQGRSLDTLLQQLYE